MAEKKPRKDDYNQVGTIWAGKVLDNGDVMPDQLVFVEGFVADSNKHWYNVIGKKYKQIDLDQKIAKGWVKEENIEAANYTISNWNERVRAEIIEVLKK